MTRQTARLSLAEEAAMAAPPALLDIDPGLIEPSFIADRMESNDESYRALLASIRDRGQIAPILVRPYPDEPGTYQVACGHRRLRAAAELGRPVRCLVKPLSDRELVIAQGQENSARAALSFIERARFAQALNRRRFGRDIIMEALSTDRGTVSRLLVVCRRLPWDIIEAIGPAPAAGRERWSKLANAFLRRAADRPVDEVLDSLAFREATSDIRFEMMFRYFVAPTPAANSVEERRRRDYRFGLSYATATVTQEAFVLRLDRAIGLGFGDFLLGRLDALYEDYSASLRARSRTGGPAIRHSLGR